MMASRRSLLLLVTGFLLMLAGCGGGDDDSATDRATGADRSGAGELSVDDSGSESAAALAAGAEVAGERREVIYTAEIAMRVDDAAAASEKARDLVAGIGGYVSQQSADLEGTAQVSITLRVPADEFDGLVEELTGLGEVLRRDLQSRDVTDQVVDLERRIGNAQVSADRLRELLAEADGVPNVLAIEAELTKRESEIEAMSGQLQVVRDQVDLSTLTVRLSEERPSEPAVKDDLPGFVRSFKAGGVAVANIGLGALAVIGFLLPFVPLVLLAWVGWRWYRKRHPKVEKAPAAPFQGWPAPPQAPTWVPPTAPQPRSASPTESTRPDPGPAEPVGGGEIERGGATAIVTEVDGGGVSDRDAAGDEDSAPPLGGD